MLHARHLHEFGRTVRAWAPLFLEAVITLASVRMALLLYGDQGYFEKNHSFYAWLLTHFPNEEWKWSLLAATAALLKCVGMFCIVFRNSDKIQDAAFLLRGLGWVLSVIFWSTLGLSIQIGDPWSLGAISCAAIAPLALAALVMGPAMPEETQYARHEG